MSGLEGELCPDPLETADCTLSPSSNLNASLAFTEPQEGLLGVTGPLGQLPVSPRPGQAP